MRELKPVCCGCGGEALLKKHTYTGYWDITCVKCGISTEVYESEAEAITAWNRAMGATDTNVGDKFAKDINVLDKERTAKAEMVDTGKGTVVFLWKCSECGQFMHRTSWSRPVRYCNYCGAKLDWGER